jgi:small-conductance mechanosensitive channel
MAEPGIIDTINTLVLETEVKLLSSFILLFIILVLRSLLVRILFQRIQDRRSRQLTRQVVNYTATGLAIILIGRLWLEGFQSLLMMLTLVIAALILTLKELFLNLAAWSSMTWRRLYSVGDLVQTATHLGEVAEIGMLHTTLGAAEDLQHRMPAGFVKIPNSLMLSQPVTIYNASSFSQEISLSMTLDSNWRKARDLLHTILLAYANTLPSLPVDMADDEEITSLPHLVRSVAVRIEDGRYLVQASYYCDFALRHEVDRRIWEEVIARFSEQGDIHLG